MPTSLKVLVVGPQRTGKTLLCKLLADQPFGWDPQRASYHPTQILRIQEVVRLLPLDKCNVQLWDCSGDHQHAQHWPVLSKGLDGLLMLYDPANPGHEEELQKFYIHLAQPHRLSKKQCMILGLSVSEPPPGNAGLQGKLRALSHNFVDLSSNPQAGVKEARAHIDNLLAGCLSKKQEAMEQAVMAAE